MLAIPGLTIQRKKNGWGRDSGAHQKFKSAEPWEQHGRMQAPNSVDRPKKIHLSPGFKAVKRDFTPVSDSNVPVLAPVEIVTGSLFVLSSNNSKNSEASNNSPRSRHSSSSVDKRPTTSSEGRVEISIQQDVGKYSWEDILVMTDDNKVELGRGGFGPVYVGKPADGRQVAVKILLTREFLNEEDCRTMPRSTAVLP